MWSEPSSPPPIPSSRLVNALVLLLFLLPMAVVHQPETGWNVNTRLALVFAVVEERTFSIDAYHETSELETMDKAIFEGRHYSDKVFGVSLLAVPLYAAMHVFASLFGFVWPFQAVNYLLTLWAVSIPAAVSLWLLWRILCGLGGEPFRAAALLAGAFFGSMWFGYSLIFMPYAPGIAAMAGALHLLLFPPAGKLTRRNGFAIGALCGFALLCDFIFGLMVLGFGVLFLKRLLDEGGLSVPERWRVVGVGAVGGALPLLLFVAYSVSIFGRPAIPYEYEALDMFREGMAEGVMGVTHPRPRVAWYLTLHPYRGVLFWSPWIVGALAGAVLLWRRGGRERWLGLYALFAFVAYLLFNSGYYMWWGGWGMGPRLMLPMLAALPLGLLWFCEPGRGRWVFAVAAALAVLSVGLNMPLSLMDPQIPQGNPHGLLELVRERGAGEVLRERPLAVPQFVYLQVFYDPSLPWFRDLETGRTAPGRLLSALAAFGALLGGLAALWAVLRREQRL